MSSDEQKDPEAPQAPPVQPSQSRQQRRAQSQRPQAGQKVEAVVDVTDAPQAQPAAAPPPQRRPHYTRVKILSALQNGDGFFPAGYEGDFPDSEIANPRLAHVFGTPEQRRAPPPLPDTPDGGSPGFEPPMRADDKRTPAEKAGF
jgi:hypothetical protein